MADLKFTITEQIALIATGSKGWSKELNLVSWNDRPAKYDIREWSSDHEKMGKGITFSKDELKALKEALNRLDL